MQLTTKEKRVELELIRAVAIFCVVFIHVASVIANNLEHTDRFSWFFLTYLDALVRWCVPVFIMVSGSLVLQKSEPPLSFFRRRLGRVGVPLLVWLPLYWGAVALFSPPLASIKELYESVFFKQPYLHFYFLFVMVQLTLLTPWLRSVVRSLTRRSLALLIILFLYIGTAYQTKTNNVFFLFIPYLGYYLYGFYAREKTFQRKEKLVALGVIGLTAAVMVVTQYLVRQETIILRGVTNATQVVAYLSPPVILMSLVAFPLFNDTGILRRITRVVPTKWIVSVGECSFGIYLIHPILQLLQGWLIPDLFRIQTTHAIPVTLGLTVLLFGLSWGIAWSIRRVPKLSWLV